MPVNFFLISQESIIQIREICQRLDQAFVKDMYVEINACRQELFRSLVMPPCASIPLGEWFDWLDCIAAKNQELRKILASLLISRLEAGEIERCIFQQPSSPEWKNFFAALEKTSSSSFSLLQFAFEEGEFNDGE